MYQMNGILIYYTSVLWLLFTSVMCKVFNVQRRGLKIFLIFIETDDTHSLLMWSVPYTFFNLNKYSRVLEQRLIGDTDLDCT